MQSKELTQVKIPDFDHYFVTVAGDIISHANSKPKMLSQKTHKKTGYKQVNLWKGNKGTSYDVHRLVALAFVPQVHNKPNVNHKDGIKIHNHRDNLEWCTQSENLKHAFATGLCDWPTGKFKLGHSKR